MDFTLTDEQQMLGASVKRWLGAGHRAMWHEAVAMGLPGLPFATVDGGIGGGPIETMVVMAELGAAQCPLPLWSSAVLAGGLLRRCDGTGEWRRRMVDGVIVSAAVDAPGLVAECRDNAWRIDGEARTVIDAPLAAAIMVLARTGEGYPVLAMVEAARVERTAFATIDGRQAANLRFDGCAATVLAQGNETERIVAGVQDEACLALGAEAVGAMEALFAMTIDHVRTRRQFGHPLGEFQVVRHRLVDLYAEIEGCRSLLYLATSTQANGGDAARPIAALKSRTGRVGWAMGEAAVQLFGGMGMSDDMPVGGYLKRLMAIDMMLGNASHHLQRFAEAA